MIRILAVTKSGKFLRDLYLQALSEPHIEWYWVDFSAPSEEEMKLLENYFHFHPLAVEDCLHSLQRPKLDYYEDYNFFAFHALNQQTLDSDEVDLFVGNRFLISVHRMPLLEVEEIWQRVEDIKEIKSKGPSYLIYLIMDKIVDQYFPAVYQIEDQLDKLNQSQEKMPIRMLIDHVFDTRAELLKLRKIVSSMRDLLYRILNSTHIDENKEHRLYFTDIHDHLLKLSEMIDANREITADMRDSYLSINSNRMNTIMTTLTVITSIFIPLTFVTGIYGMNFAYMPELSWRIGYFIVLLVMGA
ncbi:MAG: magnesium and cobalt transport protein CorA, partial [Paenibacillus sp. RIFOXYA1_FULL_44_5]